VRTSAASPRRSDARRRHTNQNQAGRSNRRPTTQTTNCGSGSPFAMSSSNGLIDRMGAECSQPADHIVAFHIVYIVEATEDVTGERSSEWANRCYMCQ
jgi:hypothetical protein